MEITDNLFYYKDVFFKKPIDYFRCLVYNTVVADKTTKMSEYGDERRILSVCLQGNTVIP